MHNVASADPPQVFYDGEDAIGKPYDGPLYP